MTNKMNPSCNKFTHDIIALKRPTALDKLVETIPKPKGATPKFGLPKWKVMPLESKIPMVPGPEGAYNFTRRKIGQRLWISTADAEFNLSDPYCYEMKFSYDSLHDNHLVPYFSRPSNFQQLIKAGLITNNLDAKCSLQDYNMYRKYLRRIHCDSVKKELKKRARRSIESRAIEYAQEQAKKEVNRLKEREKLMELRKAVIRNRLVAEKLKLRKQKEEQKKAEERLQSLIRRKKEDQRLRHIKREARAEFIKQKQKAAADIRRHKIIQTFLEWNRKERKRKRNRQMRLAREHEQKLKILEQKWEERQECQKKQIEKEQFLLKCVQDQRTEFIKTYNEKVRRETERMKRLLKDVKMYIKCYLARRRPGNKERICCEKYFKDDHDADKGIAFVSYPAAKSTTIKRKTDQEKSPQVSKSSRKPSPPKMRKLKKERLKVIKDTSPQRRKMIKKVTRIRPQTRSGIKKRPEKQGEADLKVKGQKTFKDQKGIKKQRRKRRRKKKEKAKGEIDESEENIEPEKSEESVLAPKAEAPEAPPVSEFNERCRCQIIKDAMKMIKT